MNTQSNTGISGIKLYYKEDGVYMETIPGEGQADAAAVVAYIKRKRLKSAVHRFFQRPLPDGNGDDFCPQQPHLRYVLRLFYDIGLTHMNFTFEPEIRRRGS